jgi:mitochondrial GTPase 1
MLIRRRFLSSASLIPVSSVVPFQDSGALSYPHFIPRSEFFLQSNPHWLPPEQVRARHKISKLKKDIDFILEVRDSRVPVTSANFLCESSKAVRLVILNKSDLVTPPVLNKAKALFESHGIFAVATSATLGKGISKVVDLIKEKVPIKHKSLGIRGIVLGLPNMGKSSIINALKAFTLKEQMINPEHLNSSVTTDTERTTKSAAKKKISFKDARMNKLPGTTKIVDTFVISNKPKIAILDTPGITFTKDHEDPERSLRLAALGVFPDHIAGEFYIGDYILWRLNMSRMFKYVEEFELEEPTDDFKFLAYRAGVLLARGKRCVQPDQLAGTRCFINLFRQGELGKICLDQIPNSDDIQKAMDLQWETEPPGPWGPEEYIQENWMKAVA